MATKEQLTKEEIIGAIKFGKDMAETYKENGETVPAFVYDRIIELYDMLVEMQNELIDML